jgi:ABC-type amino acid transport substrate-binding protein
MKSISLSASRSCSARAAPWVSRRVLRHHELAPNGTLRAAINFGNTVLAQKDPKTGEARGVSVDLARELAWRLQVPLDIVPYDAAGKVTADATKNVWDVAFFAIDPKRGEDVAYSAPYVIIEGGYAVPASSSISRSRKWTAPGAHRGQQPQRLRPVSLAKPEAAELVARRRRRRRSSCSRRRSCRYSRGEGRSGRMDRKTPATACSTALHDHRAGGGDAELSRARRRISAQVRRRT